MIARVIAVHPHQWKPGVHSKFVRRWKHVQEVLLPSVRAMDIEAEAIEAVMSNDLPPVVDGKLRWEDIELTIGDGCTGNTLSNYKLWKLCVQRNEPVMILEDDAILPPQNTYSVEGALNSFSQMFDFSDILYLLSQCPYMKDTFKGYHPSECQPLDRFVTRLLRTNDLACTAAYVVTPKSAAALIDRLKQFPTSPVDGIVHRAFREGQIGVVVQRDPMKGFMLNDNWAEWNHKNDPSLIHA